MLLLVAVDRLEWEVGPRETVGLARGSVETRREGKG